MFTNELEQKLLEMATKAEGDEGIPQETELEAIIAELPAKNEQGEIKAVLDWLLATVQYDDDFFVYLKRADRGTQQDWLLIKFLRDWELDEKTVISWEGDTHVM